MKTFSTVLVATLIATIAQAAAIPAPADGLVAKARHWVNYISYADVPDKSVPETKAKRRVNHISYGDVKDKQVEETKVSVESAPSAPGKRWVNYISYADVEKTPAVDAAKK